MGEGERHNDEVTKLQRSTYVKMQMKKQLKLEGKLDRVLDQGQLHHEGDLSTTPEKRRMEKRN